MIEELKSKTNEIKDNVLKKLKEDILSKLKIMDKNFKNEQNVTEEKDGRKRDVGFLSSVGQQMIAYNDVLDMIDKMLEET